jgi:uncharacterized protein (PEP-CTERM system associated)
MIQCANMIRFRNLLRRGTAYSSILSLIIVFIQGSAAAASNGAAISTSAADATAPFVSTTQGAPPFGTSTQLGNFGGAIAQMQSVLPTLNTQGLTVTPSIGLQEEFTNQNFGYFSNQQRANFVTLINPSLLVNDQRPNLNIVANYSPYIQLYDGHAYDDTIQQALNAMVDAALVPGSVNLTLRGYITEQATSGGLNPGGSVLLGPANRTMTQSYSIEPSYHHFFLGTGTLDVAYVFGVTRQNGNTAFFPNTSSPYFRNSNFLYQTITANFLTVPLFRRFDDEPTVSATQDIGTGVLNNAHQYFISNAVRYAVTRHAIVIVSGGYEDIKYQGIPPTRIRDATWSVGANLTPTKNSSIVVRYQHLYGYNAPYARANFPLTARTNIAVSYSDELTTPQQQIGSSLVGSSLNPFGIPIGLTSGMPVSLTNQTLSVQSSLQRQQVFSVSTTTVYARDTIGFSVLRQQEQLVAVTPGLTGFSQSGISGSINYTHQLTALSSLSAYLNFSKYHSIGVGNQNPSTYAAAINYTTQLSPSLYANAEYIVTDQNVTGFGATGLQNSVIVGIQKTF